MRIFKEPLLHFLLLGAGLFLLFGLINNNNDVTDTKEEIVVSQGRIETLKATFNKVWQRPPNEQELQGLINEYIREEVLYREALAMGLDRDDTIVRRRMRQKLEFLSEDLITLSEPTEEELEAFLTEYPDRFRQETRFTFQQVYLNAKKRGVSAEANAESLLIELRAGADVSKAGDLLIVEQRFEKSREGEVARTMGKQFLEALQGMSVGEWQGPIVSGFGFHLVQITERIDGLVPELYEIRDAVVREWLAMKRKETNEAFYKGLLEQYVVTMEGITPGKKSSETMVAKK